MDDSIFVMSLIDRTIIRNLTNEYAHVKSSVVTQQILDTAGYAKDLYKSAGKSYPNMDIQEVVRKMAITLQRSEDYFQKKEDSVERSINECIGTQVSLEGNISSAPVDYRILLSYLDSL